MLIPHKGHTDTIQVYSVTVMTHVKALQAGHSSQGTSEPITPASNTSLRHIQRGGGTIALHGGRTVPLTTGREIEKLKYTLVLITTV